MKNRTELLRKIEEGKQALVELEKLQNDNMKSLAITDLEEYTDEEKIKFFDKMYKNALSELVNYETGRYHDDDCDHYAWEEYIQILSRDRTSFWKYWNSISN